LASETYTQSIHTIIKIHFNNILSSTPDVLESRNDFTRIKQIDKLINALQKIQRIGKTSRNTKKCAQTRRVFVSE